MIYSFPRPWFGQVFLTSFLSTYAFHRPWVGHIRYLFVHGLDGAQIRCPRFLSRPIFGRVYLVMKGILAFLVHGVEDLNKNKNLIKSNMGIMDSHNTMYIT